MTHDRARRDLAHYFAYAAAGIDVDEDGLEDMPFGEFLVHRAALTRSQLFRALLEKDRHPGVPLGEVVAFLGYLPWPVIDRLLTEFHALPTIYAA